MVIIGAILLIALLAGIFIYLGKGKATEVHYHAQEKYTPTLPELYFNIEGNKMNNLLAYTHEMEITASREVITPLSPTGDVSINILAHDNVIQSLEYQVTTLDGKTLLEEGSVNEVNYDKAIVINLDLAATNTEETVLRIALDLGERIIYYYTRIISYDQLMLKENITTVKELHEALFEEEAWLYLDELFTGKHTEREDLSMVDLSSSATTAQWNGADVELVSDVQWKITDSTSVYTAIASEYIIKMDHLGKAENYLVEEYYRTSYSSINKEIKIQDYTRKMTQVLDYKNLEVEANVIPLGTRQSQLHYLEDNEYTKIAFVQAKELFLYDITENILTKVHGNIPEYWDTKESLIEGALEYDIEILDVDEMGNITYSVYGYVTAGDYEGCVGTSLNYYDNLLGVSVEKAFINTEKSFAIGKNELKQSIHYSQIENRIFLLANQVVYTIDLDTMEQKQISQVLDKEEYTIDTNGKYMAFNSGEGDVLSEITVLDIETAESRMIQAKEGGNIYPLAFLDSDLIIGYANKEDALEDYRGRTIVPSYEIEIRGQDNEVIKNYKNNDIYIESISIEDRVIYLNQVEKKGDIYTVTDSDYIANNLEEERGEAIVVNVVSDDLIMMRGIEFKGESENDFLAQSAYIGIDENNIEIAYKSMINGYLYYVYAGGAMIGSYEQLADAIIAADNNYGAVINSQQQYLWRRGARSLIYTNSWLETLVKTRIKEGQSAIEIINGVGPNNVHIYTGTSIENMCYLINNDQTIGIRLTTGEWILLVGYDNSIIYYIDESGTKRNANMYQLDKKVDTIIGTSKF